MFKKKFLLSTILTLSLIGGVMGCSNNQASVQTNDNPTTETTEQNPTPASGKLNFWLDKLGEAEKIQAISSAWSQEANMEIEIQNYPDAAAYQTAIQQTIDNTSAPGLFTWWSGGQLETLAKNGKIEDLTAEWDEYIANGVSPDIKEAFSFDGKAYAAPYSILYNVVLYNKEVFQSVGITEEPKTFDEFLAICEQLKAAGITPIGLKNDSWAGFIWFQQLLASYDPQLYIDICSGTKKYTDPDVKKVMEIWDDMFNKGYFAEPIAHADNTRALAQGNVAMSLEPSTEVTIFVDDYAMVSGETIDVLILPSMSDKKDVIFFEASPICVTSASQEKDSALEALRSFYKEDTQTVLVEKTGIANTSSVHLEDPSINKTVQMSSDTENIQLILRYYENTPETLRNYALDELARFIYSRVPVDEVLNNIQAEADKVFAQ